MLSLFAMVMLNNAYKNAKDMHWYRVMLPTVSESV